jgi:hypothetical protein
VFPYFPFNTVSRITLAYMQQESQCKWNLGNVNSFSSLHSPCPQRTLQSLLIELLSTGTIQQQHFTSRLQNKIESKLQNYIISNGVNKLPWFEARFKISISNTYQGPLSNSPRNSKANYVTKDRGNPTEAQTGYFHNRYPTPLHMSVPLICWKAKDRH